MTSGWRTTTTVHLPQLHVSAGARALRRRCLKRLRSSGDSAASAASSSCALAAAAAGAASRPRYTSIADQAACRLWCGCCEWLSAGREGWVLPAREVLEATCRPSTMMQLRGGDVVKLVI